MRTVDVAQGSDEWRQIRLGKVTASRVADMVAGGRGASRESYLTELVLERLNGRASRSEYKSPAMERGNEVEATARDHYAFVRDADVTTVGFVLHPTIDMAGASPDCLVGSDGLAQIKCPDEKTHLKTLRGGSIGGHYIKQMQWEMACTGRQWCDFVSFDNRFPPELQLHIQRIERDDAMIAELETAARVFLAEVDAAVAELRSRFKLAA